MTYYVPWQPLDAVKQGRDRWNRLKSLQRKTGFFTNQTYWVAEPAMAPFVTGYGVLVAKVCHKYTGITPDLWRVYNGIVHQLARILAPHNFDGPAGKLYAQNSMLRGPIAYKIAGDLFNRVVGSSNRAIMANSARLAESNLSSAERAKILASIRNSNRLICMYDFQRDYLRMP